MSSNSRSGSSQYVFRWHCDVCNEAGEWKPTVDEAREKQDEHDATHDEPLYEPSRIQRYKRSNAPGLNHA